ncbi:hypothetical protein Vse01_54350 [Micromonospora sediminimaris]|uniref:Uncharacterized protein n=1 Tax=Micromonospora sediminimaris TaxID=547162 RepID=A0A9W5XML9_9ACTN|nr:hypothetical protein Vse01_54350 [Micromonospora sediminimaris]
MTVGAGAQPGQVAFDLPGGDGRQVGHPGGGQRPEVTVQVPTVRGERVRGQSTFDGEVVQIAADGTTQGRRGLLAPAGLAVGQPVGQASTSVNGRVGRPCASATGP